MDEAGKYRARVSMLVRARVSQIYAAFIKPDWLTKFWLSAASAPLAIGETVTWKFMVKGASTEVTATKLETDKLIAWKWSDGKVEIELEPFGDDTAVTLVNDGFPGSIEEQIEAALNGTEGFSIVLSDLKTLLESGKSAGLTRSKARLIEARSTANYIRSGLARSGSPILAQD